MEWQEDGEDKIIVEALLKSPDENDAGFIMFEAKRESAVKNDGVLNEEK
jgi:hypothetical protein